jgi:sirohydrochlorin ferrochelatase
MADGVVKDVKTAFMEYTEPSIATRLKNLTKKIIQMSYWFRSFLR